MPEGPGFSPRSFQFLRLQPFVSICERLAYGTRSETFRATPCKPGEGPHSRRIQPRTSPPEQSLCKTAWPINLTERG
jgi:hypothetical protein